MIDVKDSLKFVPTNIKIADLQENDTSKHFCDISAFVPENCVAIIIKNLRVAGTGYLEIYPNEGAESIRYAARVGYNPTVGLVPGTQRFQWANTIANDDWDIFMFGYWYGRDG